MPVDIEKKKKEKKLLEDIKAGKIENKSTQTSKRREPPTQPAMLRDAETGRITGVILPDGREFPNIGSKEARALAENWIKKHALPAGAVEAKESFKIPELISMEEIKKAEAELPPSELQKQVIAEGGLEKLEGRAERFAEKGAKVGLLPAVGIGNLITAGIEKITGKKYGRTTAAELAETPAGKALGLSTLGIGTALLGFTAGPTISSWVGIQSARLAASLGVSKGAVLGVGVLGIGAVTGLKTDIIIDIILDREEASELQSSVNTIGQRAPTIFGTVQSGGISKSQGLAELNKLEDDLNIVEMRLQQAVLLDPRVRQSGQYIDILQDINDQREVIRENRADILASIPEYNPSQIAVLLEEIQKQSEAERQELINKGFLKETLP